MFAASEWIDQVQQTAGHIQFDSATTKIAWMLCPSTLYLHVEALKVLHLLMGFDPYLLGPVNPTQLPF
jgi:hypothetical protein